MSVLVSGWALRVDNPAEQGPTGEDLEEDYRPELDSAHETFTQVPSRSRNRLPRILSNPD